MSKRFKRQLSCNSTVGEIGLYHIQWLTHRFHLLKFMEKKSFWIWVQVLCRELFWILETNLIMEECPDLCLKTEDLDWVLPYILINASIFILSLQTNQWLQNQCYFHWALFPAGNQVHLALSEGSALTLYDELSVFLPWVLHSIEGLFGNAIQIHIPPVLQHLKCDVCTVDHRSWCL